MANYLETESIAVDHRETDEQEEERKRQLIEAQLADEQAELDVIAALLTKTQICSCGYYTCAAITIYGHPVPVFIEAIEPLPGQAARDRRALELKQ